MKDDADQGLSGALRRGAPAAPGEANALGAFKAALGTGAPRVYADRYELRSELGTGGGGIVYEAFDRTLDRRVALKLLHDRDGAGSELAIEKRRLIREARAMARVQHPSIVAVYDVGELDAAESEDGAGLFLVMELVDGVRLDRWLETPHSWRSKLATLVGAGRGLAAAHAAGLTHRDFKPANVIVAEDGRARVLDFGLATNHQSGAVSRADGRAVAGDSLLGAIAGTPAYMSPEQFVGEDIDASADQFGFCVVLFEALFGARPFVGETMGALSEAVLGQDVPRPSSAEVPTGVIDAILRGLSKQPSDRWPSMDALLARLESQLARRSKRRAGLIALAVAGGVAATFAVVATGDSCPTPAAASATLLPEARLQSIEAAFRRVGTISAIQTYARVEQRLRQAAEQGAAIRVATCGLENQRALSETAVDLRLRCVARWERGFRDLLSLLEAADDTTAPSAVAAVDALPDVGACDDDERLAAVEARPPPGIRNRVDAVEAQLSTAANLRRLGRTSDALVMVRDAGVSARELEWVPVLIDVLAEEGELLFGRGEYVEARVRLDEAWTLALRERDDVRATVVGTSLVRVNGAGLQEYELAGARAEDTATFIARLREAGSDTKLMEARLLHARGDYLVRAHDYDETARVYEEARRLLEQVEPRPELALARNGRRLARLGIARADFRPALTRGITTFEEYGRLLGLRHPKTVDILILIGLAQKNAGDPVGAVCNLELASRLWEPNYPEILLRTALVNLGSAYRTAKAYPLAVEVYERRLKLHSDPDGRAELLAQMSATQFLMGDRDGGGASARLAEEALEGAADETITRAHFDLGAGARAAEDSARAMKHFKVSAEHATGIPGKRGDAWTAWFRLRWEQLPSDGRRTEVADAAARSRAAYQQAGAGYSHRVETIDQWLRERDLLEQVLDRQATLDAR